MEDLNQSEDQLWWGYLHTDGSLQAKRYFQPLDIEEAIESPFVVQALGPFKAKSRDGAIAYLHNVLIAKTITQ